MREGLAREFPEAVRAASWTRARLGVWTEPVVWAAVSGIGAGFLVSAVLQSIVGLASQALETARSPSPFTFAPLVTIAASAAAAAVSLVAGGLVALALELAYGAVGIALGIPGLITFCERSGGGFSVLAPERCTAVGFLTSLWPQLVGIGLGILLARSIRARGDGINSLLRVAGGFAIALTVTGQVWAVTVAQTASTLTSGLTIAAGMVAAAVAAGVIAAQLPRGIRNAAVVAGVWLAPWLALQLPLGLRSLGPTVPAEFVGLILVTIVVPPIAAAFMVLSAAVAARSRFIPRDTA